MHFKRLTRNTVAVLAVSAVAIGGTASAASAKTVKFKATCDSKLLGPTSSGGKCTSKALGKSTLKTVLDLPKTTNTFTLKGGKLFCKGTATAITGGFKQTGKITGSGKYKKAKGKCAAKALTNPDQTFTGTFTGSFKY